MSLHLSRLHFPITSLGPGRRIGVWFQGCSLRCAGCISADTWPEEPGASDLGEVISTIRSWAPEADGLTVSGGEPFEQPQALAQLLGAWHTFSDGSVLVFTGFEKIEIDGWLQANPSLIDAVITGRYREELPQTRALRGSDNQQLHVLSARGLPFLAYERPMTEGDRRLDVMFDQEGGAWFAGIPARDDFRRLRQILKAQGHRVVLSSDGGLAR